MIKHILFSLILLTNCSVISYSEVIPLIKFAVLGADDVPITQEYIDSKKYSFAKVRIGRSAIAIFSLISIDSDDLYTWISGEGEILNTYKGKIIKLSNSLYEIEFLDYGQFDIKSSAGPYELQYDLFLYNPMAFISQNAVIEIQSSTNNQVIYESIETIGFKWTFQNSYTVHEDGQVLHSRQTIHPKIPEIDIYFYYK